MQAIAYSEFGPPPDVLKLVDLPRPQPKEREILVKVRAAGMNALDWHFVRGEPRVMRLMGRPKNRIPGVDVAGLVEAVGREVTTLRAGDEVFGTCNGGCAEYTCGAENAFVRKPARLTFEQAAGIPVAACTALLALRNYGNVRPKQSVLINGAAGGIGTFAVQIATAFGAEVTGVCSTRNLELVRSIGARYVVDYTAEDFTEGERRYDLILHIVGNRTVRELKRALAPQGTLVLVGSRVGREENGGSNADLLPLIAHMLKRPFLRFMRQRVFVFVGTTLGKDLKYIAELVEAGKVTPVVDRVYALAETAEAIRRIESGHARGKIVVSV